MDEEVTPTIGYEEEKFSVEKIDFACYDMAGASKYRDLWERFYEKAKVSDWWEEAIIFVIDATDNIWFAVVKNELELLIKAKGIKGRDVPILFFANKMDRPNAFSHMDIAK